MDSSERFLLFLVVSQMWYWKYEREETPVLKIMCFILFILTGNVVILAGIDYIVKFVLAVL